MRQVVVFFKTREEINKLQDKNGKLLQGGEPSPGFIYKYNADGKLRYCFPGLHTSQNIYCGRAALKNYAYFDFALNYSTPEIGKPGVQMENYKPESLRPIK